MTSVPQRVGNYRIEKPIGKGGTSQVVLARHVTLEDRLVAIKLLLSQDPEAVERFQREANIASRLHHPNIVPIYDHGYHAPFHYTVMEYVAGGALRGQMQEGRGLPIEAGLHIFRSVGSALDFAHAHGVVHRDVSPGNILLEQGSGRVLLTDFGIAREAGKAGVTAVGNVMGTPGYLSPEHAVSATSVTHLSDIFSLGVVLYVLLCGKLPWDHFPGMPPDHNGGPFSAPTPLKQRGAELPADVDRVIQTMLAKDPAKRYPSAQAAAEELDRILTRHTSATLVVPVPGQPEAPQRGQPLALPPPLEREPHAVERVLSLDLLKGPMQESRRRAETLSNPSEIAKLLDRWSADGRFRRRLLGRQAQIRRVESVNVYFYTLRALYETRSPALEVEEPDYKAAQIKIEKEVDRWGVKLADPKDFKEDTGGSVRLPGTVRVVSCKDCGGLGRTVCPKCEGRGRIARSSEAPAPAAAAARAGGAGGAGSPARPAAVASPAAAGGSPAATATAGGSPAGAGAAAAAPRPQVPALVPCPDCSGSGALRCKHCDGVGRMLQHKATRWSRRPSSFSGQDDLPRVDERWLLANCQPREVYCEQQRDGFRPEWQHVPVVAEMIARAQAGMGPDTRVVLSEVQISFIPMTEIVFDLGDPPADAAKGAKARKRDAGLYSWHIYGFECRLPGDWRFLNWDRVLFMASVALSLTLLVLLVLALMRFSGAL